MFVDIGAHVGLASIAFAKSFPKARVFAFEPIPATFADLEWNVRANNLSHAIFPMVCVRDREREGEREGARSRAQGGWSERARARDTQRARARTHGRGGSE